MPISEEYLTSPPSSNLAWTIPSTSKSTKDLRQKDIGVPDLGEGQVLVRLTAASLNFRDYLISIRSPAYPGPHKPDLVPAADGAGVIYSAHPSSKWHGKEGTKVVVHPNSWISGDIRNLSMQQILGGFEKDGTLQHYIVSNDDLVIEAPKNLSAIETACLPTAGATAWSAIRGALDGRLDGELQPWKGDWKSRRLEGKTVLTQGTGGVSCFAIQIAAALGATVIATSSSDEKLQLAKSLGATHLINYATTPAWDEEVLRLTGGAGVDHVIEVGGARTLLQSVKSARPGGLISLIGILTSSADIPAELIPNVLYSGRIVKGCCAFTRDATAEFARFVEAHGIKPVVAEVFEFEDTKAAFEALERQDRVGKFVVRIGDE